MRNSLDWFVREDSNGNFAGTAFDAEDNVLAKGEGVRKGVLDRKIMELSPGDQVAVV